MAVKLTACPNVEGLAEDRNSALVPRMFRRMVALLNGVETARSNAPSMLKSAGVAASST